MNFCWDCTVWTLRFPCIHNLRRTYSCCCLYRISASAPIYPWSAEAMKQKFSRLRPSSFGTVDLKFIIELTFIRHQAVCFAVNHWWSFKKQYVKKCKLRNLWNTFWFQTSLQIIKMYESTYVVDEDFYLLNI